MKTPCTQDQMEYHGLGRRVVGGQFDGGKISSDGGGLLLLEVEQRAKAGRVNATWLVRPSICPKARTRVLSSPHSLRGE